MWAAIEFQKESRGEYTGEWHPPSLGKVSLGYYKGKPEKRFYWGGGATYCTLEKEGKDYRIAKVYDGNNQDEIYLQFCNDFPPKTTSVQEALKEHYNVKNGETLVFLEGWLSPDGIYYMCEYGSHESIGERLIAVHYGVVDERSDDYLTSKGWLEIHQNGVIIPHDAMFTAKQGEFLQLFCDGMKELGLEPDNSILRRLYRRHNRLTVHGENV